MNESTSTPRRARCSSGEYARKGYPCAFPWPENCFVQAGARGVVFAEAGAYRTAFFEAFPRDPDTFLRGEGASVAEAEAACWEKHQRILACSGHDFERRGRRDGYAFCRHCDLGGRFLEPLERCHDCGAPTYHGQDVGGNWLCKQHYEALPEERWSPSRTRVERMRREADDLEAQDELSPEEFESRLGSAYSAILGLLDAAVRGEEKITGVEDLVDRVQERLQGG
jgi:hypothetical protein